jgi:hypothetical protein
VTRERSAIAAFVAFLAAWCLVLAYLATIEPVRHDGWWLTLANAQRPLSPGVLADFARESYLHGNPRLGQVLTYLSFAPGPWHVLLAIAGGAGMLVGTFVLGFGRAPRPRELGDTARLAAIAGLVFACVPNPGQMLCYRPFTGNYVWAFAVTMAFAAPYRLALARGAGAQPARGARAIAQAAGMIVLGLAAGLANEHTGPVALAAAAAATIALWRRDGGRARTRPWALAGTIALAAGVALLVGAPGQSERYRGLEANSSLVDNVLDRGALGNLHVIGMSFLYTIGAWLVLAIALVASRRARSARWRREVALLAGAALAIVLTVLVSPKQGARLFVAPALLVLAAAVRAFDEAFGPRVRAAAAAAAAVLAVLGCAQLIRVTRADADDHAARIALLRAAPPGGTAAVPPYGRFAPDWWSFGDDFRSAPLREHVARRVFGLDDAWLDTSDPRVLGNAGVSLALVIDPAQPPDPALARAADPDGEGFSEQIFTASGLAGALEQLRAAGARLAPRGAARAELRVRGLAWPGVPPLVLAWWDAGGVHAPDAEVAPAGTMLLRAGGAATRVTAAAPISELLAHAPPGGYVVATCDAGTCHALAVRRR